MAQEIVKVNNWINGESVPVQSGRYVDQISPHTGEIIAQVAVSDTLDVQKAVNAAREAYKQWSATTVKARIQFLIRFHQLMIQHADELATIINKEHGKNRAEALAELSKGNETVEYALSLPQLIQGKILDVSRGVSCRDTRRPLGVVVSIVPFNFPAMVPLWTLPIAIACGNCIIIKPSEKVPQTLTRMMQLLKEAGVPNGVVQTVNGLRETVEDLISNPGVDGVTFVGSTKVAELVSTRARALNKRVLALGGAKNHLITAPDCNPELAAQDIVNSFTGCTGQRCMAASVMLSLGDQKELVELIVQKAQALQPGDGPRDLGPVIDEAALKRIHHYIEEAETKYGARILLDGRSWTKQRPQGYWVGPTVILHSNPTDPAMREEIFGPVLSIFQVETKEQAIQIENSNPYGNAAAIYTTTGETADWFLDRFSAGMLGVNIGVPVPREPFSFGGINASKFGDMDITGDGGIEFFTKRIKITTKWTAPAAKNRTWMD